MKSKLLKRTLSSLMVTTLVIGSLVGCGNASAEKESKEASVQTESTASKSTASVEGSTTVAEEETGITYPLEEDVTLKIAYQTNGTVTAHYKDLTETRYWEALQENTGVKLEAMELGGDALRLMLLSGELPDIIIMKTSDYPGGLTSAILDGVVEPLNDYAEYMPDLMEVLESEEIYWKGATTNSDEILGAPFIRGDDYLLTSMGVVIRDQWLDELGLEMPDTPDEFYEVLKAFKEEKGANAPFSSTFGTMFGTLLEKGVLTGAFGIPRATEYVMDGEVKYGFAQPEMKEVFAYLKKLYDEGLIDPDITTVDATTVNNNIKDGTSGAIIASVGGGIGGFMTTMEAEDPDYSVTGMPSLASADGERAMSGCAEFPVTTTYMVMTTSCSNKEAAVKFLNYGYTEEGGMFYNYGIEGESYNMVDGKPVYTEWVTKNPDGWSMAQALANYCCSWNTGAFVQQKGYMEQFAPRPQQTAAIEAWSNNDALEYMIPPSTILEEYNDEYTKINSEIYSFVTEMIVAYMTGVKSLDNFETEFLGTLESLGVNRLCEIRELSIAKWFE